MVSTNNSGVLYEVEEISVNNGGTLYAPDELYANDAGVLREIFGSASAPKTLTWHYKDAPDETPTVSNNGFTVANSSSNTTYSKYQSVVTDAFTINGEWNITVNLTRGNCSNAGAMLIDADGNSQDILSYPSDVAGTTTVQDGEYRISCGGGYGNQSGSFAGTYKYEITFEKA